MKSIENKLNAYDEICKKIQNEFLPEFKPEKIKTLIDSQKTSSAEKQNMQVLSFSRMLVAEQSLRLLLQLLNDLMVDIDVLKDAVYEKQGGGPKIKKEKAVARKEWIAEGLEKKRLPRPQDVMERIQIALTGKHDSDDTGEYVLARRTLDLWTASFKNELVDSYIATLKKEETTN